MSGLMQDTEESGDEFFDATDELPRVTSAEAISARSTTVEEDDDFYELEEMSGIFHSHKTVIMHILSQIRVGMDLTRFVLPVFILEKRSLLEMYAEFFSNPDLLVRASELPHPKDRIVAVTRWYLSTINASKKGAVAKKPYNPVLGETFHCYWNLPGSTRSPLDRMKTQLVDSGPVPYAGYDSLSFVAEQVSHHPPISAFYVECPAKRIYVHGSVCTKTKFTGFGVKAQNIGAVHIHLLDYDEVYIVALPNGYVRGVLSSPWFEFGGNCPIECAKTGYVAVVDFHRKPFRGGQKHRVTAEVRHTSEKQSLMDISGEWNSVLYATMPNKSQEVFLDAGNTCNVKKKLKKLSEQEPTESRVVWREVTEDLRKNDLDRAADAKYSVEEKQRADLRERQRTGTEWHQKDMSDSQPQDTKNRDRDPLEDETATEVRHKPQGSPNSSVELDSDVTKHSDGASIVSAPRNTDSVEGDPPDVEEDSDYAADELSGTTGFASHKTMIKHILSQIRLGMDLTRFALPVFILEKRSLLEMYADFFSYPHLITEIVDFPDPKDRMLQAVKIFLGTISASRKGAAVKKPYNPILGETFSCYWDLPNGKRTPPDTLGKELLDSGPVPFAGYDSLSFVAEQVSHHPPISALYAECPSKKVYVYGNICTKTKFLGLSVKASNIGTVNINLLDFNEEYVGNLPHGYARSILTGPWFEFGGKCKIECAKTGYVADVEFHCKSIRGGRKHRVTVDVSHKSQKKPCTKIEGEWDNVIYITHPVKETFLDANIPTVRKKLKLLSKQDPMESRVVWGEVTEGLKMNDLERAAAAKHVVEEAQRDAAKERQQSETEWKPKFYHMDGALWQFNHPLNLRLKRGSVDRQ